MFAGCLASFFDDSGFALALPGRPAVCDSVIVVRYGMLLFTYVSLA